MAPLMLSKMRKMTTKREGGDYRGRRKGRYHHYSLPLLLLQPHQVPVRALAQVPEQVLEQVFLEQEQVLHKPPWFIYSKGLHYADSFFKTYYFDGFLAKCLCLENTIYVAKLRNNAYHICSMCGFVHNHQTVSSPATVPTT